MTRYAATPAEWDRVVAACYKAGICGLDTETYGHDIEKTSAPYRAQVHVWSLGVLTAEVHPRGHHIAGGVVLPAAALLYDPIRRMLEDGYVVKVAHNAPHDVHALANHRIRVGGWVDSLPRARVMFPTWMRHGLKTICRVVDRQLHKFEDVCSMMVDVPKPCMVCCCLDDECELWRRRSKKNCMHFRIPSTKLVPELKMQPLESIVPGHPLWPGLVEYAGEDAVTAMELWDYMDHCIAPTPLPPVPWAPVWNHDELDEMQGAGPAEPRRS